MELKVEYANISLIWDHDLDAFIGHHLGRPWSLQQEGDMYGQNTLRTFEVFPDPEATAQVEQWLASPVPKYNLWTRDEEISTETLLSELCNRGLLPEGRLYVHIWW